MHDADVIYQKPIIEKILGSAFVRGNYVRLLRNGKEIFQTIFDSIESARHIICIEFYIFKNDNTGKNLSELLRRKAQEGVKIYVLYDQFGSLRTPRSFWQELKNAGISIRASHPFKWSMPGYYIHRDHGKLIAIDGEKAFTGGFNIGDEYHGYFKTWKKPWRDTGIYLEGPVASSLLEMFKKSWASWGRETITYSNKALPVKQGVSVIPVFTRSARGRKKLRKLLFYSISNAKERIFLTNAYFAPSRRMLTVLEDAVKRGVDVKLILPSKSDIAPIYYAGRHFYKRLLEAGVEIYDYQGQILHAKTALFDSCWSIIGSANLDFQSLRRNDESNVGIFDENFGTEMTKVFLEDLHNSIKIDINTWSKRPFYEKILERVFAILRKRL